jgi:hypothetical protein
MNPITITSEVKCGQTNRRIDRRTYMKKLIVTFRDYAKMPKIRKNISFKSRYVLFF